MKEAFYFRHDYNARNDGKILKLRAKFGNAEGYGLFWMLIEWMAEQENGSLDGSAIDELSLSFGIEEQKIRDFIDYCITIKLLCRDKDTITSPRMIEHKKFRKERSASGKLGSTSRWKDSSAISSAMKEPLAEPMQRKGKERTVHTLETRKIEKPLDTLKSKLLQSIGIQDFLEDDREQVKLLRKIERMIASAEPGVVNAAWSKLSGYYGFPNFRKLDSIYRHFRSVLPK